MGFELFSRAWCVAEIAAAHKMGMVQKIKVDSVLSLDEREADLKRLRIQDMKATRPEDIDEILSKIPDPSVFNEHVQHLLFEDLLPGWRVMDPSEQLERVGHVYRWQEVAT